MNFCVPTDAFEKTPGSSKETKTGTLCRCSASWFNPHPARNLPGHFNARAWGQNCNGIALVIVLAFLVLITTLVIAFFSSVTSELSSAKSYAGGVSCKQLTDSTVQIVQAQITAATTPGTPIAWSSQPGLIRTYDNTGNPANSYKLYSAGTMQMTGALNPSTSTDVPAAWFSSPALYTDLNAPVVAVSGTTVWPILDPTSFQASGTNPPTPRASASPVRPPEPIKA